MSEHKTDTSGAGPAEGQHKRDKDEFEATTSYQPTTNQAQDEPLPASHHDESGRREADRRRGGARRDGSASPGQTGPDETEPAQESRGGTGPGR